MDIVSDANYFERTVSCSDPTRPIIRRNGVKSAIKILGAVCGLFLGGVLIQRVGQGLHVEKIQALTVQNKNHDAIHRVMTSLSSVAKNVSSPVVGIKEPCDMPARLAAFRGMADDPITAEIAASNLVTLHVLKKEWMRALTVIQTKMTGSAAKKRNEKLLWEGARAEVIALCEKGDFAAGEHLIHSIAAHAPLTDELRYILFSRALESKAWQIAESICLSMNNTSMRRNMLNTLAARLVDQFLIHYPLTEEAFLSRMDQMQSGATRLLMDIQLDERAVFNSDERALQWLHKWRDKQRSHDGFCAKTLSELVREKFPSKTNTGRYKTVVEIEEAIKLTERIPSAQDDILATIAIQAVRQDWTNYDFGTLDRIQNIDKRVATLRSMMEESLKINKLCNLHVYAVYDIPTRNATLTEELHETNKKIKTLPPEVRSRIDDNCLTAIDVINQYVKEFSFDLTHQCWCIGNLIDRMADPVKKNKAIDGALLADQQANFPKECRDTMNSLAGKRS